MNDVYILNVQGALYEKNINQYVNPVKFGDLEATPHAGENRVTHTAKLLFNSFQVRYSTARPRISTAQYINDFGWQVCVPIVISISWFASAAFFVAFCA